MVARPARGRTAEPPGHRSSRQDRCGTPHQTREIGGGCGTTTQPFVAYFGLGEPEGVEKLEVRWPSGIVQTLEDVATNQILTIEEVAAGSKAPD